MTERLLREIRGSVGDRGVFLICEKAGPDGRIAAPGFVAGTARTGFCGRR